MRSEGTMYLRPFSSLMRKSPSPAVRASATSFSTSSGDWPLDTTSSRGVSLMPILTSTWDLRWKFVRDVLGKANRTGSLRCRMSAPGHFVVSWYSIGVSPGRAPACASCALVATAGTTRRFRRGRPTRAGPLLAFGVPWWHPREQRGVPGEAARPADDELGQPVSLGDDVLGLGQRLAQQAATPQGELVAGLGVGFDAGRHLAFGEGG